MGIEEVPFSDLLSEVIDNRGKTCPTVDTGIPLIATNCIRNESLYPTYDTVRFVSQHTYSTWFRGHPRPGDIVFVNKATPGRVCMVPDPVDFCIAQDMVAVRANPERIYPKYLFAALRSPIVQERIAQMHVGTLIPHFKKGDFDKLLIPVPSREDQKSIGDVYFNLSAKIELNRRMNETLEAMARAIFKSWFVDFDPVRAKLRGEQPAGLAPEVAALFPDALVETELGEAPEGWGTGSFLDVADLLSGGTPSTANSAYWNGDIPWVSAKDVSGAKGSFLLNTEKAITQLGVQNSSTKILPAHTTIITARGTVGSYCLLGSDMAMNQTNYGLRAKRDVGDFFVFFSTAQLIEHLQQQAYGTIFDTITTKTFRDTVTVQPPQPLLGEFEAMAEPIMMRVLANEQQSRTLAALRDTLLPKLISGELRVADAERIVGATA